MDKISAVQWDKIGTICFTRREKRNALDRQMISQIITSMKEMEKSGVQVLIFRAEADSRVWSAGYDMEDLPSDQTFLTGTYSSPLDSLIRAICLFPGPVAAMVNGSVWGGACEIVLSCDVAIGDSNCSFAVTPAKVGVPYSTHGVARFLKRLPLNVTKEMFFTGRPISATTAQNFQILNHVVDPDQLESFTFQMAREMSLNAPLVIKAIKEQTRILSESKLISSEAFEYLEDLRRRAFESNDFREGRLAFQERRPPAFRGT